MVEWHGQAIVCSWICGVTRANKFAHAAQATQRVPAHADSVISIPGHDV